MECKYCDDYTGICTNPECPLRADACPVPDTEGICKYEDRAEEVYKLTPKGCAVAALMSAGLIKSSLDPAVDAFFEDFERLMKSNGYVRTETEATP